MDQLYSTKDAAAYLKVSVSDIKYHVHTAHTLHPQRIGHSLVFTQEELDRFNRDKRKPGRPTKGA